MWLRYKGWHRYMMMRIWSNWNSHTLLVRVYYSTITLGKDLAVSFKIKHTPTLRPWHSTLSYLPKVLHEKIYSQKSCKIKFVAALFIRIRNWKEPRCPSVEKLIANYSIFIYLSTILVLKIETTTDTSNNMLKSMFSERSQSQKSM